MRRQRPERQKHRTSSDREMSGKNRGMHAINNEAKREEKRKGNGRGFGPETAWFSGFLGTVHGETEDEAHRSKRISPCPKT